MRWHDMTPGQNLGARARLAMLAAQRARNAGDTATAQAQDDIAERAAYQAIDATERTAS